MFAKTKTNAKLYLEIMQIFNELHYENTFYSLYN